MNPDEIIQAAITEQSVANRAADALMIDLANRITSQDSEGIIDVVRDAVRAVAKEDDDTVDRDPEGHREEEGSAGAVDGSPGQSDG